MGFLAEFEILAADTEDYCSGEPLTRPLVYALVNPADHFLSPFDIKFYYLYLSTLQFHEVLYSHLHLVSTSGTFGVLIFRHIAIILHIDVSFFLFSESIMAQLLTKNKME